MITPLDELDAIARAVLYEGHLLYPYDPRAPKNRHRWLFGRIYPNACRGGEPSSMQTECIVVGSELTRLSIVVRFLQIAVRDEASYDAIPRAIEADARSLGALASSPLEARFEFPRSRRTETVRGMVELCVVHAKEGVYKVRVRVHNTGALEKEDPDSALLAALVSTHAVLSIKDGSLVSPRDPPADLVELAASCRNVGAWPILVGPPGSRDTMLCSPIILDDYPRIARESRGDLFDATEIEELLTLHVLALTDDERHAMQTADEPTRAMLERMRSQTHEERLRLHGRLAKRDRIERGSRVVLRPHRRADVFDRALAGKAATVQSVEQDVDGRVYFTVIVDDDPGSDLGAYGHRFFFAPDEVDLLDAARPA